MSALRRRGGGCGLISRVVNTRTEYSKPFTSAAWNNGLQTFRKETVTPSGSWAAWSWIVESYTTDEA